MEASYKHILLNWAKAHGHDILKKKVGQDKELFFFNYSCVLWAVVLVGCICNPKYRTSRIDRSAYNFCIM